MGRLRQRLDRLEGQASQTMGDADQLIAAARALLDEIEDGVTFELVKTDDATLMDFVMGRVEVLPIKLRIVLTEGDDAK